MEQNHQISNNASVCNGLPTLPANYPWLVAQRLEANDDNGLQSFHTVHDRWSPYQCRIPELFGRRIRGCYHDWVILSSHPHNAMWSLWNPTTSKFIRLPPLPIYKDENFDDIGYCCLSSPPGDPTSVLLLLRTTKPNLVFCKVDRKRKKSRWTEMSYAKQLKKVCNYDCILRFLTCSNGRVYALGLQTGYIILIDIVVENKNVLISLSPFQEYPLPAYNNTGPDYYWMKGSNADLFCIRVCFESISTDKIAMVFVFKLDMTSTTSTWEEVQDLKDGVFLGDISQGPCAPSSVFYNPAIPSQELKGHIYIRGRLSNVIYSYNVKDKTVSLTPMFSLDWRSHVSLWECRLGSRDGPAKSSFNSTQEVNNNDETVARSITDGEIECSNIPNESPLLNIPFHLLEKLMGHCVGIEYMYFRATCKRCNLAAPVKQWGKEAALGKLETYSLDSPWLMVLEDNRGIMKFTDPIFGDKYFINTLPVPIILDHHKKIYCSRFGWLLFYSNSYNLVFYNPFTSQVIELPPTSELFDQACFSAPPTSRDCIVVGFARNGSVLSSHELRLADENPLWHGSLQHDWGNDSKPQAFYFPTFYGQQLFALRNEGVLIFYENAALHYWWRDVGAKAPKYDLKYMTRYYLVKVDQHLLLVTVGGHGEFVHVYQLNGTSPKEWVWEKINSIGQHMIYICDTTCLCIEAKTPKMKNKIFFSQLHSDNGKIVFYSLETCMFHIDKEATTSGFLETKHLLYPHVWIEPSWK